MCAAQDASKSQPPGDEPTPEPADGSQPEAAEVTVALLGGESFQLRLDLARMPLTRLLGEVAARLGAEPWEILLCRGAEVLDSSRREEPLATHGACDGSLLTAVRRPRACVRGPGASAFNAAYRCTVLRVEEVGWDALELEFSVVGDMSLGKLQDPRASRLEWKSSRGTLGGVAFPSDVSYDVYDLTSHVLGRLTYVGVPAATIDQMKFTFGRAGYGTLPLRLRET